MSQSAPYSQEEYAAIYYEVTEIDLSLEENGFEK